MADKGSYKLSITAVDETKAAFDAINKRMTAMAAPFTKAQSSIVKSIMGVDTPIGKMGLAFKSVSQIGEKMFGGLGAVVGSVASKFLTMIPLVGSLTGLFSLSGISRAIEDYARWGQALDKIARYTGVAGSSIANFQGAARLAGASADDVSQSFANLGNALLNVKTGVGEQGMLGRLIGLSGTEDVDQAFRKVMAAVSNPKYSTALRNRLMAAFGISSNLARINEQGGVDEWLKKAKADTNGGVTPEQVQRATALGDAYNRLGVVLGGLKTRIVDSLSEPMTRALNAIATGFATTGNQVLDAIGRMISGIRTGLEEFANTPAWAAIRKAGVILGDTMATVGDGIGHTLRKVVDLMAVDLANAMHDILKWPGMIADAFSGMGDRISGVWDRIKGGIIGLTDSLAGLLDRLSKYSPFSSTPAAPVDPSKPIPLIPSTAPRRVTGGNPLAHPSAFTQPDNDNGLSRYLQRASYNPAERTHGDGGEGEAPSQTSISSVVVATLAYLDGSSRLSTFLQNQLGIGGIGGGGSGGGGGTPGGGSGGGGSGVQLPGYTPFGASGTSTAGDASLPRGLRNNNPLNLSALPGQESDGRFRKFQSQEDGYAAALNQLRRYQGRGLKSVADMIKTWAPPTENDTAGYTNQVSRDVGVDANAPVDLTNPETAAKMVESMSRRENGRTANHDAALRGVRRALGLDQDGKPAVAAKPPAPAPAAQAPGMQANAGNSIAITVHHDGSGRKPNGTTQIAALGPNFEGQRVHSVPMVAAL